MKGFALLFALLALAACGDKATEAPVASEKAVIDQSVADVAAAEAAASTPLPAPEEAPAKAR